MFELRVRKTQLITPRAKPRAKLVLGVRLSPSVHRQEDQFTAESDGSSWLREPVWKIEK